MEDIASAACYLGSSVFGIIVPLIAVIYGVATGTRAIAGDEEAGSRRPRHDLSVAYGVNERGQVVGTVQSAKDPLNDHAFVWYDGAMVDLNDRVPGLPGSVTLQSAQDINDDGVVVGIACPVPCHLGGDEQRRGFLLTPVD